MNTIPVVFICDENYVLPTCVAIVSMKKNKLDSTNLEVYVLSLDISSESKNKIESLSEKNAKVIVLEQKFTSNQLNVVQKRDRVTHAALLKFELPNIFQNYSKIIYLDSDTLILKDLTVFFNTNITYFYAAVVKDIITRRGKEKHLKWLGFQGEYYFNSGVMLLNLEKMRNDLLPEKLLQYRINGKNHFMDQDALNVIFNDCVKFVSPYYNLLNCFFEWEPILELSDFYEVSFPNSVQEIYEQATILHLGDKKKPWIYEMGYLSTLYKKYYKKSPYKKERLVLLSDKPTLNRTLQCYKENGLRYTLQRIKVKIRGKMLKR